MKPNKDDSLEYIIYCDSQEKRKKRRINAQNFIRKNKDIIFQRDGYKCKKCGSKKKLTVDHIDPISEGGWDSLENTEILCEKCNLEKGNKIVLPD